MILILDTVSGTGTDTGIILYQKTIMSMTAVTVSNKESLRLVSGENNFDIFIIVYTVKCRMVKNTSTSTESKTAQNLR